MAGDAGGTEITGGTLVVIEIKDLSVFFGRTIALDHVDLVLRPGVVGVFGQNASGKSTLLRVLAGLLAPTSGAVSWEGTRIGAGGEEQRARIGYAGHDSGLYRNLSLRENLLLFGRLYGVPPTRADAVIDTLGVRTQSGTLVARLSAGVKRRAAIGRALLHDPDLLLLDEPYAHLDDDASEAVSRAVQAWRGPGKTAVIATHGAKRIRDFTEDRVVLQRGRVVSHLDPEALASRMHV